MPGRDALPKRDGPVLVCTLGVSWQVVAEVFGFVRPDVVDLYAHHPDADAIRAQQASLPQPRELWVITTAGALTAKGGTRAPLEWLQEWWRELPDRVPLRVFLPAGLRDIETAEDSQRMAELALRVVLRAAQTRGPPLLSLAGGRKTMSADLHRAATLFGAAALLHVAARDRNPSRLRSLGPTDLASPLPPDIAGDLHPLVIERALPRAEFLDVDTADRHAVRADAYPLPDPPDDGTPTPCRLDGPSLRAEVDVRRQEASRLTANFFAELSRGQLHENWRMLYRLPVEDIRALQDARIGGSDEEREWVRRCLPKADLHCHLGGLLDLSAQRRVAERVWPELGGELRRAAESDPFLDELIDRARRCVAWPEGWAERLRGSQRSREAAARRTAAACRLLRELDESCLKAALFDPTEPRVALRELERGGFAAYERPGELAGSALLGVEVAVEAYADEVARTVRQENLRYLEVRGSPDKYLGGGRGPEFVRRFRDALPLDARERVRFLWVLDRRQPVKSIREAVDRAVRALDETLGDDGFIVGFDLAGDEAVGRPEQLAPAFEAAFRRSLFLTVHAGEGRAATPEAVWAAVYHLHADRLGHGLTVVTGEFERLVERLRARRVCIEVCPTSNREVVGFRDPRFPETADLPPHPMGEMIRRGLPVAICTDNPGISRTTITDELFVAARMLDDGLSPWHALALVRQAFQHAFLPASRRSELLKEVDVEVYHAVLRSPWLVSSR